MPTVESYQEHCNTASQYRVFHKGNMICTSCNLNRSLPMTKICNCSVIPLNEYRGLSKIVESLNSWSESVMSEYYWICQLNSSMPWDAYVR